MALQPSLAALRASQGQTIADLTPLWRGYGSAPFEEAEQRAAAIHRILHTLDQIADQIAACDTQVQ